MYFVALACASVLIASGCCQDYPQRPYRPYRWTHPNQEPYDRRYRPDGYYTPKPRGPRPPYLPKYFPTTPTDVPNTCDTSYDAVAMILRDPYIFKGRYFWRIGKNGIYPGFPAEIHRFFNLPRDVDHIDAAYERPGDRRIVFFVGREYYVFHGNGMEAGYPRPLTDLGLPSSLEKIDGAMVWGHDGFTYFFSGHQYWRFDESVGRVQQDYPRDMSDFAGVGYNIDAVFQWKNGKTYFFKGKGYWEFDDLRMKVAHEKQKPSATFLMGCPYVPEVMEVTEVTEPGETTEVIEILGVERDEDNGHTLNKHLKKFAKLVGNFLLSLAND